MPSGSARWETDFGPALSLSSIARRELPDESFIVEGDSERLSAKGSFLGRHILVPKEGVSVHINAFNFPCWGMLEKIAPSLIAGVPVGRDLLEDNPMEAERRQVPPGAGSAIAVVATDAPLLPRQCKALARRVPLGLARTGTTGLHFSGDLFLAFSTANPGALASRFPVGEPGGEEFDNLRFIPWGRMDPFYAAVVQGVEEAVVNALVANETMIGRDGHRTPALPRDRLAALLRERGAPITPPR